jgi:hypothetical protein
VGVERGQKVVVGDSFHCGARSDCIRNSDAELLSSYQSSYFREVSDILHRSDRPDRLLAQAGLQPSNQL